MSYDLTFCSYCGKQYDPYKLPEHDCPEKQAHEAEGRESLAPVSMTLNRRERRAAMARAKARIKRESKK